GARPRTVGRRGGGATGRAENAAGGGGGARAGEGLLAGRLGEEGRGRVGLVEPLGDGRALVEVEVGLHPHDRAAAARHRRQHRLDGAGQVVLELLRLVGTGVARPTAGATGGGGQPPGGGAHGAR